jgi:hypothetical protein
MGLRRDDEARRRVARGAEDVYRMEQLQGGGHEQALAAAVAAAVMSSETLVLREMFASVIAAAEALDAGDDDLAEDGVASLLWFAREMQESIPMDDRE